MTIGLYLKRITENQAREARAIADVFTAIKGNTKGDTTELEARIVDLHAFADDVEKQAEEVDVNAKEGAEATNLERPVGEGHGTIIHDDLNPSLRPSNSLTPHTDAQAIASSKEAALHEPTGTPSASSAVAAGVTADDLLK